MIRSYRRRGERGVQMALARLLRDARESTGKTREVFSGLIGVGRRRIDRIERGESRPTGELVERWLNAAEWSLEIIGGHRRELEQVDALRVTVRRGESVLPSRRAS